MTSITGLTTRNIKSIAKIWHIIYASGVSRISVSLKLVIEAKVEVEIRCGVKVGDKHKAEI